jgi:hypothetical protein
MDEFAYGDAPVEAPDTLNYGEPNVNASLGDAALSARAARADFALGDKSPGHQVLKDQFRSGGEPQARMQAAATADAEFRQDKLNVIKDVAAKGHPVTDGEVNGLMTLGTTPEANPDTVFEDKFAKNMVNYAVAGDPGKNLVFQTAFDTAPQETQNGIAVAKGAISRKAQAQDVLETAKAAHDALPWVSFNNPDQQDKLGNLITDLATGGIATYVNQRNLLNESPSNSFLPGSNKLEQIQYLYLLPHADFKPTLMAAAGPGSDFWKTDPKGALAFVQAAVQFSTSDAYVDNLYGVVNVASIIPVGTGLKAIAGLRGGKSVAQGVQTLDKALAEAQDVLKASPKPPVTAGDRAAAGALDTAESILRTSPTPEAKFYMPESAVKRPWETQSRLGEARVENGKPRVFTQDGAEVSLRGTPEVGDIPVTVEAPTRKTSYTTKSGTVDYNPDQPGRTIYVSKKDSETLSQSLDPDKNFTLLRDDKGVHVADLDNIRPGKMVPTSRVPAGRISDKPGEGLYPVHIPEGTAKPTLENFGERITRVDDQMQQNIRFGSKIVEPAEIETRVALADIVKAQAETHPQDVLSKMGQHEAAATLAAETNLTNRFQQVVQGGDVEAIRRNVPSLVSPQSFFHNASSLTRERAQRLADEATRVSTELGAAILDPTRVERLTAEAYSRSIEQAKQVVRDRYNRASDSILDQVSHWDSASNTYYVESRFGKRDGTLFDTSVQAEHYRSFQYRLGKGSEVKQEGNQFYISHIQHADETKAAVRDGLIVSENTTPQGFWNTLVNTVTGRVLGKGNTIRSSAFTSSEFQMNNRTVATHAPSIMRKALEDASETFKGMSKSERHDLQRILESNRDFMEPTGERGQFYKSALEFETAFNSMHGKLPTEKQIAAYDQFTRLSDFDWVLRELDWHRDKARQGVRNYQLSFKQLDEVGVPSTGKTGWFNGKKVDNFDPVNTQDANIYIMPESKFTTKFKLKSPTVEETQINAKIKSGEYQIIQVYNPGSKPLRDATKINDNIHFVVVDKYEDKAIKFGENSVYRPGGHVIYQDQYFMKQPQIGTGTLGRETHFGDTSVKSFAGEREGTAWVQKYETARKLLKAGDEKGLKDFIDAGNLPETLPEFKKLFTGGGANLSVDHPFVLTATGRNTFESSEELARAYPGLKDTFSSYDLTQTQDSKFLASRDKQLNTIANKGTEENPIYADVPSRLYDPYTALQKGVAQIVRARWMGDYKTQAAESWVQEFGLLFDQSKLPQEKLRQNPVYWMGHAEGNLDVGFAKKNPELYQAALVSRKNILNFIGARDEVGALMEGLEKKVVAGIESIGGTKLATKAEETFLPMIKDAPAYARAGAFHSVIGMFNPVQLFQQAQGLTHVLALSPLNGLKGTTASALARVYRYTEDPAILASAADKAAALGWNKDHFTEAWNAWKNSGTHNIGGETATLSQLQDPVLFKSGAATFLDKGQMFFKAGESIVRDTAFFTAYSDWRAANATAALDNRAMGDITRRFDTLSMNMTRASNAAYNEGLLSPVTQFWTWNARFTEQMVGKQLTWGEKARAVTAYSTMYGVPATLGGITFGTIPMLNYQDIRQYALKNNIDVTDKFYQAFSEGLPAMLTNAISGHDTDFQRFAPNATQISDIISGKKGALEVIGGASGGFVKNVYNSTQPFRAYIWSGLDSNLGLKMNDFVGLAETLSGFSNIEKAYIGMTTGKFISKNEMFQGDVDSYDSFMLALGLTPKTVSDAYQKLDLQKAQKGVWEKTEKIMMENYKLGFAAAQRGEYQTMTDYMNRNNALSAAADFTQAKKLDVFKKATGNNESLVDSVNQSFLKNTNQLQSIPALKRYYELQEKRK